MVMVGISEIEGSTVVGNTGIFQHLQSVEFAGILHATRHRPVWNFTHLVKSRWHKSKRELTPPQYQNARSSLLLYCWWSTSGPRRTYDQSQGHVGREFFYNTQDWGRPGCGGVDVLLLFGHKMAERGFAN